MDLPPTSSPLSVAVVGVGGIGSTFAFQLARAGHEVTVVARPGSTRLQQLQRDGGVVRTNGERATLHVTDALPGETVFDLVIVTTLAHQVDAVLPALQRGRAKWIHFMFNVLDPERLGQAVGVDRCSFGMPFVMATVDREGHLASTINPGQKTLHGDRRWVDLFVAAGIPSAFEAEMARWLRCHVPLCISFESISVAGVRRGAGASWAESMVVARGMHGAFTILKAQGHRLYPFPKQLLDASPVSLAALLLWLVSRIVSFRELLATGAAECRALCDALVATAAEHSAVSSRAAAAVGALRPAET